MDYYWDDEKQKVVITNDGQMVAFDLMESATLLDGLRGIIGTQCATIDESGGSSDRILKVVGAWYGNTFNAKPKVHIVRAKNKVQIGIYVGGKLCHKVYSVPSMKVLGTLGFDVVLYPVNYVEKYTELEADLNYNFEFQAFSLEQRSLFNDVIVYTPNTVVVTLRDNTNGVITDMCMGRYGPEFQLDHSLWVPRIDMKFCSYIKNEKRVRDED